MAVLSNGVETIEVGSNAWRIVCNTNFQTLNDLITDVNNVKNSYAKNDLSNLSNTSVSQDISFTDETKGVILVDRADTTKKYRLYIDSGELHLEEV